MMLVISGLAGGGCSSHVPLAMQPVVLVVAPFALAGQAIDNNLLAGTSNADFVAAGRAVDEQGRSLDGVQVSITTWKVTHRQEGYPDAWETGRESRIINGDFNFTF